MDWEQRYREDDTPWERGAPAPPLVEFLQSHRMSGRVLVPGCGLGNDARCLAAHGCETLGVDIAPLALEQARARPAPHGAEPLSYLLCDFLDPENGLPEAHFDWVFEHTCFCAIDPKRRADYVNAAARALKPAGRILAIIFTDLEDADDPPYPTPSDEVEALFGPRFEILESWKPSRCFPGRENEETMYLMRKR